MTLMLEKYAAYVPADSRAMSHHEMISQVERMACSSSTIVTTAPPLPTCTYSTSSSGFLRRSRCRCRCIHLCWNSCYTTV